MFLYLSINTPTLSKHTVYRVLGLMYGAKWSRRAQWSSERVDEGQGVESSVLQLIPPCSCNFWPTPLLPDWGISAAAYRPLAQQNKPLEDLTRSSAITEGPRDALLASSCYVSRGIKVSKVTIRKSDLQGHLRAVAMVPFDKPHTISYQYSIATMSLSCTVSEIYYYLFVKI